MAVPSAGRAPATGTESPDQPVALEYTTNVRMVRRTRRGGKRRHSPAESALGASPNDRIRAGVMLSKIPRERYPAKAFRLHST